ncbi:hypothetical protein SEA_SPEEDDEMON_430 [Gordonia phage SpeedDemon]|nr:hypothetical protein SEA_SPEEDDEMON_430 [Gordonia phage SpeedDemon]
MSLNYMVGGQMVQHTPKLLDPNTGQFVDPAQIAIWDGTKFVKVWPEMEPYEETVIISSVGAFAIPVPPWAIWADVAALGGGGGGGGRPGASTNIGKGGSAAVWSYTVGRDVSGMAELRGSVGAAGAPGPSSSPFDGGIGGHSWVEASSWAFSYGASGGAGNTGSPATAGGSVTAVTPVAGFVLPTASGGASGTGSIAPGDASGPGAGGGGAGGGFVNPARPGGSGGRGEARIRFRNF